MQHCYWNLEGLEHGPAPMRHELTVHADAHVPLHVSEQVPVGGVAPVPEWADFREPATVESKLCRLPAGAPAGFNTAYLVRGWTSGDMSDPPSVALTDDPPHSSSPHAPALLRRLRVAAELYAPTVGRRLTIFTTQPSVHLYTAFAWDATKAVALSSGTNSTRPPVMMVPGGGVALECQSPPDSANQAFGDVPRCILRPGETYHHLTLHKFQWNALQA
jgi:aldose 1-epimerase